MKVLLFESLTSVKFVFPHSDVGVFPQLNMSANNHTVTQGKDKVRPPACLGFFMGFHVVNGSHKCYIVPYTPPPRNSRVKLLTIRKMKPRKIAGLSQSHRNLNLLFAFLFCNSFQSLSY